MILMSQEVIKLNEWFLEHIKTCPKQGWSIKFSESSGSGIGTNTYAECICGEKKDITDYESW